MNHVDVSLRARAARGAAIAAALVAAACGTSPPDNFYTLGDGGGGGSPAAVAPSSPRWVIAVGPVAVPELVDRPQLVVRTGAQRVALLESHRWAQPLAQEIATALAGNLNRALPEAHAYAGPLLPYIPAGARALQVSLRVDKFESWIDATPHVEDVIYWTASCPDGDAVRGGLLALREAAAGPLETGRYSALVAAHAKAVETVGTTIASMLEQMADQCRAARPAERP